MTKLMVFASLLGSLFTSCAYHGPPKKNATLKKLEPIERSFSVPIESVWRAAQKSLKYQIAIDNMEHGILETDWIRSEDGFTPAHLNQQPSSGMRFKITVKVLRGKKLQKDATRITISKVAERQRDFFSEGEDIEPDFWEEKVLLYRIEREIAIEEALKKGAFLKK